MITTANKQLRHIRREKKHINSSFINWTMTTRTDRGSIQSLYVTSILIIQLVKIDSASPSKAAYSAIHKHDGMLSPQIGAAKAIIDDSGFKSRLENSGMRKGLQ